MQDVREAELIALARSGDAGAMDGLLSGHSAWVRRRAAIAAGRYPQLDEATVESLVYEALWAAIRAYSPGPKCLLSFAYTLATRAIFAELRSLSRIKRRHKFEPVDFALVSADSVTFPRGESEEDVPSPAAPCVACGTVGGRSMNPARGRRPTRLNGMCCRCNQRAYRSRRKAAPEA